MKNLSSSFFFFFRTKRRFSVRSKAWKLFRFVAGRNVMHFNRPFLDEPKSILRRATHPRNRAALTQTRAGENSIWNTIPYSAKVGAVFHVQPFW